MEEIKTEAVPNGLDLKNKWSKLKRWKKILIGVGVFIVLVIMLSLSATSGIVNVSDKQLNLISSGNLKGAYELFSQEFQRSVSYDNFMAYVNNYEVLKNYKEHSFTSREIQGETGTITGTLTAKDGTVSPVEYKFIKENDEWKILSINLSSAGGINGASGDMQNLSDSNLGYSIQYPKDWTLEKPDPQTILLSGPKEKDMYDVTINIQNLASANRGAKYTSNDSVVKDLKNQIRSMDKNATFNDFPDTTKNRIDGMELTAKSFVAQFVRQGKNFAIMQIVLPHGDSLTFHSIGYTAPIEKFEKYSDLVQSILKTLQINK